MWLQTRRVRHLVHPNPVGTLCGEDPRMWFGDPKGEGTFVFDKPPHGIAPVNFDLPICTRCKNTLAQLNEDNR